MLRRFSVIATTLAVASSISTLLSFAPPASAREIVTCESVNNRRNVCYIGRGRVRFIRQVSDASCRGNWGYVRDRVWVRNGCRAQFAVPQRYNRGGRYDRYDRDNRYDRGDRYERQERYDRDMRYNGY
ncbi:DUF3011 domain-containing protein [Aliinostoc sp. HNIBRCY26]|uniref:DUF3011 domain-containing protein n=1 Tax=Aliinostoc sp. HNIBRCY26 TaxID=3418997 RepID=UPI003CFCA3E6